MHAKLLTILFFLSIFLFFFRPPLDLDLGWHLRSGDIMRINHQLLRQNSFSYTLPNYLWSNSYLFYQLALSWIYQLNGLLGLSILGALLITLAFFISLRGSNIGTKIIVVIISIYIIYPNYVLGVKAQISTVFGLLILSQVLTKIKDKPILLCIIPPMFTIWANLHGGFILGFYLLTLFALTNLIQEIFSARKNLSTFLLTMLTLAISIIFSLINPYGLGIWFEAIKHIVYQNLNLYIFDWQPTLLPSGRGILIFLLLGSYFLLERKSKRQKTALILYHYLVLISFTILAFLHRRDMFIYPFITIPLWINLLSRLRFPRLFKKSLYYHLLPFILMISTFYGGYIALSTLKTISQPDQYCDNQAIPLPCDAVAFVKSHRLSGNLFNWYNWGGFLIYHLSEYKVFIDGRMPAWNQNKTDPFDDYAKIVTLGKGWEDKLNQYSIGWIIIPHNTMLNQALSQKPNWQLIYEDQTAVIYQKNISTSGN